MKLDLSDGRIAAIRFACSAADDGKRNALIATLRAIEPLMPPVLADRRVMAEGAIGDTAFLDRYADRPRQAVLRIR